MRGPEFVISGIRITKSARVYSFITITIVEEDVWEAKGGVGGQAGR